jgi:hypothetical protein
MNRGVWQTEAKNLESWSLQWLVLKLTVRRRAVRESKGTVDLMSLF